MRLLLFTYLIITQLFVISCKNQDNEAEIVENILSEPTNSYDFDIDRNNTEINSLRNTEYKEALGVALFKKASYYEKINKKDSAFVLIKQIETQKLFSNAKNPESEFQFYILKISLLRSFNKYSECYQLLDFLKKKYPHDSKYLFRIYDSQRSVDGVQDDRDYFGLTKSYYHANKFLKSDLSDYKQNYQKEIIYRANFITTMRGYFFILNEDIDSSRYYAKEMLDVSPKLVKPFYRTINFVALGLHYINTSDFKDSKLYFDSAKTYVNKEFANDMSIQANFNYGMVDFFDAQKQKDSALYYFKKQSDFERDYEVPQKSSIKSFDKMDSITLNNLSDSRRKSFHMICISLGVILILIFVSIIFYKRYSAMRKLDDTDQPSLNDNFDKQEILKLLVKAAENNSPELLTLFSDKKPDFIENLRKLNDSIRSSEIRFIIYLYLNFTTKDIAHYTNTSVRTVQSRKYNLRKKYNIPSELDLYIWVKNIGN